MLSAMQKRALVRLRMRLWPPASRGCAAHVDAPQEDSVRLRCRGVGASEHGHLDEQVERLFELDQASTQLLVRSR